MGAGLVVENRFRKWFPNRAKNSTDYHIVVFWPLVVMGIGAWVGALYVDKMKKQKKT